jgi:hypothetical protein
MLGIKNDLKELHPSEKQAHDKDKKSAITGTLAVTTTAAGSAVMELVNEALPFEYFAGAGAVGFLGWAIIKVFMVEAEAGLEHYLE